MTVTGGAFGADGPGTTSSALSVTNAASGLTLTDGTAITLSLVGGQIIGTVGADAANPSLTGKVAFAIAIDPPTGQVYVAQYLSLHQDSATTAERPAVAGGEIGRGDGDADRRRRRHRSARRLISAPTSTSWTTARRRRR